MPEVEINCGWNAKHSVSVAELYEEAFGSKFSKAISSKQARINILSKCFIPDFSYVALVNDEIVGLAGFQTQDGSLTGNMNMSGLISQLGLIGGIWAGLVFSLFERRPKSRELVMDGIVVDKRFRSRGLGSRLLDRIIMHAEEHGFESVRLDVIDTNPRARKLYESKGFSAKHTESFPYLKWLLGFTGSTTMVFNVRRRA